MLRKLMLVIVPAVTLIVSTAAIAEKAEFGTADEAKAMLDKVIAALKADKAKALAAFNKAEAGFKDRDLYPFCFNTGDGKITANSAHQELLGTDLRTLKDKAGKTFGKDIFDAATKGKEGGVTEVSYMFPRPGSDPTPVAKVSFVTRIGDQGCGVGYYKK